MSNWKSEVARDIIALGGIPFYSIVLIRVLIGEKGTPFYTLTYQVLLAAVIILLLSFVLKKSNNYVSRSLSLLVFTSLNYSDIWYTSFASLLWVTMIISLVYMQKKKTDLLVGFFSGIISSGAAYYLVKFLL